MENNFCENYETIEEAQSKYPSTCCENCDHNNYDYNTGITTCTKLENVIMNNKNN